MNWASKRAGTNAKSKAAIQRLVAAAFLCAFVSPCLLSPAVFAQQRPLLTEDPRLISTGALVAETGFGYFNRVRFPLSGLGGNEFSLLSNGFNFGLGPRAEFQINGVVRNFLNVHENGSGWRNDWGDWSLSTKIRILPETPVSPIISFKPTVVLPNSNDSRGIGTNSMQFFGNVLSGKTIGRGFVFGNAGLGILTDPVHLRAQQDVFTYGIAGVLTMSPRISLLSEWNGWKNPRGSPSPGTESRSQVRLGMQVRTAGIRWDVAGVAGLTRRDPRVGLVFGLTKEFRLWK